MIEHSDLSYPVYIKLREMIITGALKPGQKLLQEKLAKDLGVSRTPLLKALQMLEYDYLVESIPRRGMAVKKISVEELLDIYDVREGIESITVRLVTERISKEKLLILNSLWTPFIGQKSIDKEQYRKADDKFHALLLEFSQNQILQKTYSKSMVQARVVQMGLQRPPEETLEEHLSLVNAIAEGNKDEAEKIIKLHVRRSKACIEINFSKQKQHTETLNQTLNNIVNQK